MAKAPVLSDLTTITGNETSAINTINANNDLIEASFLNTLSLDGCTPNAMLADLDMNSNRILNVGTPTAGTDGASKDYVDNVTLTTGSLTTPGTSTDNALVRWNGTTGLGVQDGQTIEDDSGNVTIAGNLTITGTHVGHVIGTNVQAWDAQLDDIAALAFTDSNFIVGDGSNWVAETGATVRTSLGLAIGVDIEAFDADTTKNDVTNTFTAVQTIDVTGAAGKLDIKSDNDAATAARIGFFGHDDAAADEEYARLTARIVDNTAANPDGDIEVATVVAGTLAGRGVWLQGLTMTGATGGDQGVGTINATGVFDDGVILTCYVFDQHLEGSISGDKWDAKVPDRVVVDMEGVETVTPRTHGDMRKFRDRIGTEYDPLDIDKYAQHWKDKKHLTAMPNEDTYNPEEPMSSGKWIQRLIETVETQAIHIDNLNQRLKTLEGA